MTVNWGKCNPNSSWCGLKNLNIDHEVFNDLNGVYIIWSVKVVIRIGSGIIRNRLKEHRESPEITAFPNLFVTWANVNGNQMEGVEKYLSDRLNPKVGERFPDRTPIEVNLPW
jgi:hypothetical protein